LIRPTVWPQYTNVTDRQDRTDRQTGQRSDSIGRTVLQTVAQKLNKQEVQILVAKPVLPKLLPEAPELPDMVQFPLRRDNFGEKGAVHCKV